MNRYGNDCRREENRRPSFFERKTLEHSTVGFAKTMNPGAREIEATVPKKTPISLVNFSSQPEPADMFERRRGMRVEKFSQLPVVVDDGEKKIERNHRSLADKKTALGEAQVAAISLVKSLG